MTKEQLELQLRIASQIADLEEELRWGAEEMIFDGVWGDPPNVTETIVSRRLN